jgi:NPCBM/NEW2 domain
LQDVVTLGNGDVLKGIVIDISADKVTLQPETGDPTPVPLESVAAVMFATPAGAGPTTAPAQRALKVKLSDGSSLTAAALTGDDSSGWSITLPGAPAKPLEGSVVVAIEQVNGPVSWLSSRTPSEIVQVPYLGTPWPTRFDRSVKGGPIKFGDKTFGHGIGVHAYSRLTYPLDGAYKSFRTQYAMDGDLPYADVTVRVLLDGKVVHEQKNFRAGVLCPVVQADLAAAKSLTLEVDFGDNYDTQDRFNWIEPALVK